MNKTTLAAETTDIALLTDLSTHRLSRIRAAVAVNPACPKAVWDTLSNDRAFVVRKNAFWNTTHGDNHRQWELAILIKMSENDDIKIRPMVASNPNTPVDVLRQIAEG